MSGFAYPRSLEGGKAPGNAELGLFVPRMGVDAILFQTTDADLRFATSARTATEFRSKEDSMASPFWERLDELLKSSEIVLDHPNRVAVPPIDYGYLSGTSGGDGQEIDVWQGSLGTKRVDTIVCTVDLRKLDAEVKVLIGCSDEEKQSICKFHTSDKTGALLVERKDSSM